MVWSFGSIFPPLVLLLPRGGGGARDDAVKDEEDEGWWKRPLALVLLWPIPKIFELECGGVSSATGAFVSCKEDDIVLSTHCSISSGVYSQLRTNASMRWRSLSVIWALCVRVCSCVCFFFFFNDTTMCSEGKLCFPFTSLCFAGFFLICNVSIAICFFLEKQAFLGVWRRA